MFGFSNNKQQSIFQLLRKNTNQNETVKLRVTLYKQKKFTRSLQNIIQNKSIQNDAHVVFELRTIIQNKTSKNMESSLSSSK